MKNMVLLVTGVTGLFLGMAALAEGESPDVRPGDTLESVVQKLGKPQGVISGGRRSTYYYQQGTVDFVTGRVERAMLVSVEEGRERAARREREEQLRIQAAASERARLTEAGSAALARAQEDKSLAARPATERVEFWKDFAKRYPYTDVTVPSAQAAEAAKVEQKDRDQAAELVTLNKRVGEIQERFGQLDADYAASLANWKRNEIDAERAKLKDELAAIATRLRDLGVAQ